MVSVLFQTESHFPVSREKIKAAVMQALVDKIKSRCEVSISIIGDRRMQELNRHYRQIDSTTDVLSFPLSESTDRGQPFVEPPDKILRLGDILVSYPQAVAEAAQENKMVDDKIVELVLHGLNHLLGIHHEE